MWFIRQKKHINPNFNFYLYYKKNGIYSFYNALLSTYIINASFIIYIPLYEKLKTNQSLKVNIESDNVRIFLITSVAKIVSACIFYPIDTIRTIKRNNNSKNLLNIIKKLNKNPLMYYSGLKIYLIRSIPYYATTFCVFEYCKKII